MDFLALAPELSTVLHDLFHECSIVGIKHFPFDCSLEKAPDIVLVVSHDLGSFHMANAHSCL